MRRLKPKVFKTFSVGLILCLSLGRCVYLHCTQETTSAPTTPTPIISLSPRRPVLRPLPGGYNRLFHDVQDTQIVAARQFGIEPLHSREEVEQLCSDKVVFVGSNPYYIIDSGMTHSTPFLVPRAAMLLDDISRAFLDSLHTHGLPPHKLIVTSVLRTASDVRSLQRGNVNATTESCHRFGTTIDIAYSRFHTIQPPSEDKRRTVRDDTLKHVLGEVLRDMKADGRCYVMHERKQGCFHITTR